VDILGRAFAGWVAVVGVMAASAAATAPSLLADQASAGRLTSAADPDYGTYEWPLHGPVIRTFEAPAGPFGAGHRGIDIAAPAGSMVRAADDGVVAFAGPVAGARYVSIDHPDGVRTTYSWLTDIAVRAGDPVQRGDPVGTSGLGHPGVDPPHLHFGARYAGVYLDPALLLGSGSVVGLVRLAPLDQEMPAG
jgi:murein DD-endopeptidase MepM/ murein hydrolase activator NlpD